MKQGYLYTHEGAVYIADELKPDEKDYLLGIAGIDNYKEAMFKWLSKLLEKPVKNVGDRWNVIHDIGKLPNIIQLKGDWWWNRTNYMEHFIEIKDGQPCHYIIDDGYHVTELR